MTARNWKSIVVAIRDPQERSQNALRKAAEIAQRCGSSLSLLHVFRFPYPVAGRGAKSTKDALNQLQTHWEQKLEQLAQPLRSRGLKVKCVVAWAHSPHEGILSHVAASRADLLIAESHRHNRLARWLLSNTDWELIRHCPSALWFVKSAKLPQKLRLLAAVDPLHARAKTSQLDEDIIATAAQAKDQLGGELILAHACEIPMTLVASTPLDPMPVPLSVQEIEAFESRAKKAVAKLAREHGIDDASQITRIGTPELVIEDLVKERKIDVVVMGAVSRRGVQRAFIGSTAEHIIDSLPCDLLIAKGPQKRAPARKKSRTHRA